MEVGKNDIQGDGSAIAIGQRLKGQGLHGVAKRIKLT